MVQKWYLMWTWVIMTSCGFISCDKCTAVVRKVDNGEAVSTVGRGIWEISVFSLQFFREPKPALKK